jgi:Fe-Mn family superoxide dismutase
MTRRELMFTAGGALAALPAFAQTPAPATLPKLGYATDALEPFIDAKTMEIHHDKHHQAYVDNLNKALAGHPDLAAKPLDQLLKNLADVPEPIRNAVRNNGGGHANHSLFWQTLAKSKAPAKGKLRAAIDKSFGSQSAFDDKLKAAGLTVFGSGWVWVVPGKDALTIETSPNQDSPWLSGRTPVFGIDVWEHAYYLKYQNRRADYLTAFLQVINYDFLSQRYEDLTK